MLLVMSKNAKSRQVSERARDIAQWLEDEAPHVRFDQRHLDGGTPEQAYWHLGYLAALRDVVALLSDSESTPDSASRFPAAGQDG